MTDSKVAGPARSGENAPSSRGSWLQDRAVASERFGFQSGKLWLPFRMLWEAIVVSRISVLSIIAGWLMLSSDQGQDALLALAQTIGSPQGANLWLIMPGFLGGVALWAVSTWYWALTMLRFDFPRWNLEAFGEAERLFKIYVRWLPAILALLAFCAVYTSLATDITGLAPKTKEGFEIIRICVLVMAGLFLLYELVHRRLFAISEERRHRSLRDLSWVSAWFLIFTTLIGLGLLIASWSDPVSVGAFFRPEILFLVWAGTFIPLLSIASYWATMFRVPFMLILFCLAIVFSFWNDNHALRTIDSISKVETPQSGSSRPPQLPARATVGEAAQDWATTVAASPAGASAPFIIVATAGGGSRAAYWTTTVLGRLQDCYPRFRDHLFAISGVSGGSVGAAVFRGMLSDTPAGPGAGCSATAALPVPGGFAERGQQITGTDLLTANLAALLYPDLVQRFLPLPIASADRARALELALEHSYTRVMGTRRLGQTFAKGWNSDASGPVTAASHPWPGLFLNGSWVETGRRVMAATMQLSSDEANSPFTVAHDLLTLTGRDIPMSAAASLSARFPYVLPAATIFDGTGGKVGHVVDGGYFENFGAETAAELLSTVRRSLGERFVKLKPVVVQISSDPTLPTDFTALCDQPPCNTHPIEFAPELRSPVRTFMKTREARGLLAAANLSSEVESLGGVFVHFRLCSGAGSSEGNSQSTDKDPPLGWALSDYAKSIIDNTLTNFGDGSSLTACQRINAAAWRKMDGLLR